MTKKIIQSIGTTLRYSSQRYQHKGIKTDAKEVFETINSLNFNKSEPKNDIPTRVPKRFSGLLCGPIAEEKC